MPHQVNPLRQLSLQGSLSLRWGCLGRGRMGLGKQGKTLSFRDWPSLAREINSGAMEAASLVFHLAASAN